MTKTINTLSIFAIVFSVAFMALKPDTPNKTILSPANEPKPASGILFQTRGEVAAEARKNGFTRIYCHYLKSICSEYQVPVNLVMNLIYCESRFDSTAKSKKGCQGYMQLNPINTGGKTLTPADNLLCGVAFLWSLHRKYGNWRDAINFYGSGYRMNCSEKYINFIING
ncbi:MAG: transglycosylase SLT domain-containing protein [Mariniphaga sp.]|nr:transglycosylase SLT domain-containing protein [Mariniphaga sp.]